MFISSIDLSTFINYSVYFFAKLKFSCQHEDKVVYLIEELNYFWIAENNSRNYEVKGQTKGEINKGMILPFQPLTMMFHKINYFVDMPKVVLLKLFIYIFIVDHQPRLFLHAYRK